MADKKTGGNTMSKTEYVIDPGKYDIVMTRVFDAPRELVFKAYTDPKLFAEWWGPRDYKNRIDKFEARRGGEWRGVPTHLRGKEDALPGGPPHRGAPQRPPGNLQFEGMPGHRLMQNPNFPPPPPKTH